MPEKADEFKKKLDGLAAAANKENVDKCLELLENKMVERAQAGKYDIRVGIRREYLTRMSEKFIEWDVEVRVAGTQVRNGMVLVDLVLQWHEYEEKQKALGFGQGGD